MAHSVQKILIGLAAGLACLMMVSEFGQCVDEKCLQQSLKINAIFKKKNPITKFKFNEDSKDSLQLTWVGENTKIMLAISVKEMFSFASFLRKPSTIYLSKDSGKSFENITSKIHAKGPIYVQKGNGLYRNPRDPNSIFILCHKTRDESILFRTSDGAKSWSSFAVPFKTNLLFSFHPTNKRLILSLDKDNSLWISKDAGEHWKTIFTDATSFFWGQGEHSENVIFVMKRSETPSLARLLISRLTGQRILLRSALYKSSNAGAQFRLIRADVFGALHRHKFLYVSVAIPRQPTKRRLMLSTDLGAKFHNVHIPIIKRHQSYAVVHIDENQVFLHMDSANHTNGIGTLFTSDATGLLFSRSLQRHYHNRFGFNDFYAVASIRGTFFTNQVASSRSHSTSLRTVVTFNAGATWTLLRKPAGLSCGPLHQTQNTTGASTATGKTQTKDCHMQISGAYSMFRHVRTLPPLSTRNAVGLVIAHAHMANYLKTRAPDVFVSSDGGYNWALSLRGPHSYEIADHGGLLVAVARPHTSSSFSSSSTSGSFASNQVKFSTDEGRCWHTHNFTAGSGDADALHFQGLVTEPGNRAMTVALYGYGVRDKLWRVHTIDLGALLARQCGPVDYEVWTAHSEMRSSDSSSTSSSVEDSAGCLLGLKEKFQRLKKDALCRNGYLHKITKSELRCKCTKNDYECDFGFWRPINSWQCQKNSLLPQLSLCDERGRVERIETSGYRKLPGDRCTGGWTPAHAHTQRVVQREGGPVKCSNDEQLWSVEQAMPGGGGGAQRAGAGGSTHGHMRADAHDNTNKKSNNSGLLIGISILVVVVLVCVCLVIVMQMRRTRNRNRHSWLLNSFVEQHGVFNASQSGIGGSGGGAGCFKYGILQEESAPHMQTHSNAPSNLHSNAHGHTISPSISTSSFSVSAKPPNQQELLNSNNKKNPKLQQNQKDDVYEFLQSQPEEDVELLK